MQVYVPSSLSIYTLSNEYLKKLSTPSLSLEVKDKEHKYHNMLYYVVHLYSASPVQEGEGQCIIHTIIHGNFLQNNRKKLF